MSSLTCSATYRPPSGRMQKHLRSWNYLTWGVFCRAIFFYGFTGVAPLVLDKQVSSHVATIRFLSQRLQSIFFSVFFCRRNPQRIPKMLRASETIPGRSATCRRETLRAVGLEAEKDNVHHSQKRPCQSGIHGMSDLWDHYQVQTST